MNEIKSVLLIGKLFSHITQIAIEELADYLEYLEDKQNNMIEVMQEQKKLKQQ